MVLNLKYSKMPQIRHTQVIYRDYCENSARLEIQMKRFFLTSLLVAVLNLRQGEALKCLNCDAAVSPLHCTHVTDCFPGETCGSETYMTNDGDVVYNLGCVSPTTCGVLRHNTSSRPDFKGCSQCCGDHDLCNVKGCGSTGYPSPRGPVCYNCEQYPEGRNCHRVTHCETDEVCYTDSDLLFQTDVLYTSGCRSKHHCPSSAGPAVGRRDVMKRTTTVCSSCCDQDLCNAKCHSGGGIQQGCSDDEDCQLLMKSYNVCSTYAVAVKFCRSTCGLCHATTPPPSCVDVSEDCSTMSLLPGFCDTMAKAQQFGCLRTCGFCGVRTRTFPAYTHTTPTWSTRGTTTPPRFPFFTTSTPGHTASTTTSRSTTVTIPTYGPALVNYLHVGSRVVRGQDWKWESQDGHGPGTITNLNTTTPGWVEVRWDKNGEINEYRLGAENSYDLMPYTPSSSSSSSSPSSSYTSSSSSYPTSTGQFWTSTTPQSTTRTFPTSPTSPMVTGSSPVPTYGPALARLMKVGTKVVRGMDWKWNDQDNHSVGTVIDVTGTSTGWVRVRWAGGSDNTYRMGAEGAYDLKLA